MISNRKFHRRIGLVMLIPLLAWAATGMVFFIKPGYEGAYEILQLKTYPLEQGVVIPGDASWDEARLVRSILGSHLLVRSGGESQHLDPVSLEERPLPAQEQLHRLFQDVVSQNPNRYGRIENIEGTTATTSNAIQIKLNWDSLNFSQQGFDRTVIDLLYKVHYLQWTPWASANLILGIVGLFLLLTLSLLGIRIYLANRT